MALRDEAREVKIVGILLAAGAGRRFETDAHKLVAPLKGRPLISFALDAMRAGCGRGVVVQGALDLASFCPPDVALVENAAWQEGLASSLRRGLSWAAEDGADAAVVGLADAPGIPAEAWRRVAACDAPIAVASFSGLRHPPVRLAASVWDEVPTTGERGARALFARPDAVAVACPGDPRDIDTVADLERWCAEGVFA